MLDNHSEEIEGEIETEIETEIEWTVCDLELESQIEALVFASDRPLTCPRLLELLNQNISIEDVEKSIDALMEKHERGGFRLIEVPGAGYQFQTRGEAAPVIAHMFAQQPRPLSRAALETLAIIAYRQPVTRAAMEFIRGVDSGSIVKNLLERELIRCVGRKEDAPGKPMIFGTGDGFLQVFGIRDLSELPPLSSFQTDSETMQTALKELDAIDQPVAIEDFIGDEANTTG